MPKSYSDRVDPAYTDILALKRTNASSALVAASLIETIVKNSLKRLSEKYPMATEEEILQKLRKLLYD